MTSGAGGGNFNIIGVDLYILRVDLGQNNEGSSGGVNPAVFFGNGDALDPVGTGFPLELVISINAGNFDDIVVELRDLPANFIGIADVHPY